MSFVAVAAAALIAAPAAAVDLEQEKRELLRLGEAARAAHLAYDAAALIAPHADGFVSVGDGRVNRPSRDQSRAMVQRYFDSVIFKMWDDTAPPVVTVSDDATLATVLVQKRVRLAPKAKPDGPVTETDWAWVETWRKQDGAWRMQMIVSTQQPAKQVGG
jgi:hypothetical protein